MTPHTDSLIDPPTRSRPGPGKYDILIVGAGSPDAATAPMLWLLGRRRVVPQEARRPRAPIGASHRA